VELVEGVKLGEADLFMYYVRRACYYVETT